MLSPSWDASQWCNIKKIETNITCVNSTNSFEKQKGREALLPSVNLIYKEKEHQPGKEKKQNVIY